MITPSLFFIYIISAKQAFFKRKEKSVPKKGDVLSGEFEKHH